MRIRIHPSPRGIALIIVMVVIIVLGVIAGGFAYSMKVETTLARNASFDTDFEWLGRSGVELARYVLALQAAAANEPYDSLNQKWAGGTGGYGATNEILSQISLENNVLGKGKFSIKIIDQERKVNINTVEKPLLMQTLVQMGVDGADASIIVDSIFDWRDPDNDPGLSGWESDDYLRLEPPYVAKNGPIDDISELLRVHGVTPEIYWGSSSTNSQARFNRLTQGNNLRRGTPVTYPFGLVDVFSAIAARQVNVNTASAQVLELVPGIDANVASAILRMRAGPDGADGTEDDMPFRDPRQIPLPGADPQSANQILNIFAIRSQTFEVQVDAEIGKTKRQFMAMLRRNPPRDIQILYMYAK